MIRVFEFEISQASTNRLGNHCDSRILNELDQLLNRLRSKVFSLDLNDGADVQLSLLKFYVLDF